MKSAAGIVLILFGAAAATRAQSDLTAARAELVRVQTAMGGAAELAKITSIRISSTQSQWASSGAPRNRTETRVVSMLLPNYVLFEQQGDPRRGWAVDTPIALPDEPDASKATLKEDFAWQALRTLLRTDTPFRLTLRAFVDGSLQFDAPNGVHVFLDIDPQTHLPSRLRFTQGARTNAGDPIPGRTVAYRWELDDYRVVGTLRLSHQSTWFVNDLRQILDRIDKIELNPQLTPKDFVR